MGIDDREEELLPTVAAFSLAPPVPNPFNPETTLRFTLDRPESVVLAIYDLTGRRVRTLVSAVRSSGPHSVTWTGDDDDGRHLASGVYLARLETTRRVATQKLVMIK